MTFCQSLFMFHVLFEWPLSAEIIDESIPLVADIMTG